MTANIALVIGIVGFITAVLSLLPRIARPTLPFGVRVPERHVHAPAVQQATRQYYVGLALTMLVVTAALIILAFVVPLPAIAASAPFVTLGAWFVPYLSARRTVLDAKHAEGWFEGIRQTAVADTSWRTSPPRYPWAWAVPAVAIAVATLVIGIVVYPSLPDRIATHIGPDGRGEFVDTTVWTAFGIVGIQILLTALLLGLVAFVLRSKPDIAAGDPQASADQYRRYSTAMAKSVLVVAFGTNLATLIVTLTIWEILPATTMWIVISLVPALAVALIVTAVGIRTGQSGHRLRVDAREEQTGTRSDRDDDAYWIAGLFYRNADDPSLWVPKRYGGVGWTINVARPAAWAIVGLILAVAIGVPIVATVAESG